LYMSKKMSRIRKIIPTFLLSVVIAFITLSVQAEDTEIYKDLAPAANSNVMFILDLSGSMSWNVEGVSVAAEDSSSRLNIMKEALIKVLDDAELKNINMGLMGFSGISPYEGKAHGPTYPVVNAGDSADYSLALNPSFNPNVEDTAMSLLITQNKSKLEKKFTWFKTKKDNWFLKLLAKLFGKTITFPPPKKIATIDKTNTKEYIQMASNTWQAMGGTPIVDSLYEATLYFKGEDVDYGRYMATNLRSAHPSTYAGQLSEETLPPTTTCSRKTCYGSNCDNATKQCTNYPASTYTQYCYDNTLAECETKHPTWTGCYQKSSQRCTTTCPENKYDEYNRCINPQVECTPYNYYSCQVPYSAGASCNHEVCTTTKKTVVVGTPKYISPINSECQTNRYILLSDGAPTINESAKSVNGILPTGYSNSCQDKGDQATGGIKYFGRCGAELVTYLHQEDQSALDGKQTIETTTIGFALNSNPKASEYLQLLAKNGGGEFYSANDLDSLTTSFKDALLGANKTAHLFTTPSFSIDPSRLLEHDDAVYLPVFSSNLKPRWSGNLKKFKLVNQVISDKKGIAATSSKGVLRPDAQDEWAALIPEHAVEGGGAASLLDPAKRNLLTDTSGSTLQTLNTSSATKTLLGNATMDNDTQTALLNFIQGYEKDGITARQHMGDIIHSKPTVITYGTKKRIFVGTNEGFLHSFDVNGVEKFAFMPKLLLRNIDIQYRNDSSDSHPSGVDGEITTWMSDTNDNGQWDSGEKVILFFGLRRGGNAYYALDVSDPDANPTLLWKIDASMSGFSELAQSWSTPVLTQIRYGADPKDAKLKPILIFGGGYNTRIDETDKSTRISASTTNAGTTVFIVDALGNGDGTTNLLWNAEHADMKYSIPANIRALDMDRNGSVDRLYFGDMGGNIWRVDLNAGNFATPPALHDLSKAKVTKLAALGANTGSDLRKFFSEPDVAFFRHQGQFLLTLAIGSGYRAHPLNENIVDRFYVLRDQYVLRTPDASFITITETGTKKLLPAPVDEKQNLLDNNYYGWYRDLTTIKHEKVLASATTFMNRVSFTSFGKTAPQTLKKDSCEIVTNFQSRAYVLDLLRGDAVIDFDSTTTGNEASIKVSDNEIVSTPQIIFGRIQSSSGESCTKKDCHQSISMRAGKLDIPFVDTLTTGGNVDITTLLPKVFWREEKKIH
jgi:Tfp pilus tip-associated adhesin PilY1